MEPKKTIPKMNLVNADIMGTLTIGKAAAAGKEIVSAHTDGQQTICFLGDRINANVKTSITPKL
ncbi:hypothetical protein [Peribacillus butanolivorans]